MTRRLNFIILLVVFCLGYGALSSAFAATSLTYADHDPDTFIRCKGMKVFFQYIEEETQGRIKISPFFGGALGKSEESLRLVEEGAVDMGFVYPDYFPNRLKAVSIFKTFAVGPQQYKTTIDIYKDAYKTIPGFSQEIEEANQKVILFFSALPAVIMGTDPVASFKDMEGKKWRTSSRWVKMFLSALNVTPVNIPWEDQYMALQTGVADGTMADLDGLYDLKMDEVAPYIYFSPAAWFATPFLTTINLDSWNKLSKADQDGILKAADRVNDWFTEKMTAYKDTILKDLKKRAKKVTFWSDNDLTKWKTNSGVKKAQATWIEEAQKGGLKDAQAIMDKITQLMNASMTAEK